MMKKAIWIFAAIIAVAASFAIADGVTINVLLDVANGNFALRRQVNNYQFTQAGTAADYGIQSVTVNTTNNLNIYNTTSPGYVFLRNLSTNHSIYVTCVICLNSNDVALLPVSTTNMTAYTTAGTNNLEYWVNSK